VTHLYGPAVRCKLNLQSGSDWSCSSGSGPCVEQPWCEEALADEPDLVLDLPVCTENLIRVDDVMESPKLAE
jgi:hypothetical protein